MKGFTRILQLNYLACSITRLLKRLLLILSKKPSSLRSNSYWRHSHANLFISFWRRVKAGQPCGRPGSSQVSPAGGPGQPRSALRAAQVSPGQPCGLTGSSSRQVSPQRAPRVSRVNPQRAPGQACARSMHAEQTSPLFVLGPRPQPRAATDHARTRMAQPINQTS